MSYDTARPYLACFIILRRGNKIAFIKRSNTDWMNGFYALPAGKAEIQEAALLAAVRESKEEVDITINPKDLKFVHVCHRKAEDQTKEWIDLFFEATRWQGEPYNAEPLKHSELIWINKDALLDNVLPEAIFALDKINSGQAFSQYGWN